MVCYKNRQYFVGFRHSPGVLQLIPRDVFEENKDEAGSFNLHFSVLEIYKEEMRDLLQYHGEKLVQQWVVSELRYRLAQTRDEW